MPKKILVADDEAGIVFLLKRRLMKSGYDVITANDGPPAFALAQKELPDLLILDVMMPDLDGLTVCFRLKTDPRYKHMKIILLTARDQQKDKHAGETVGADVYVTKPFEPEALIKIVKELLGE